MWCWRVRETDLGMVCPGPGIRGSTVVDRMAALATRLDILELHIMAQLTPSTAKSPPEIDGLLAATPPGPTMNHDYMLDDGNYTEDDADNAEDDGNDAKGRSTNIMANTRATFLPFMNEILMVPLFVNPLLPPTELAWIAWDTPSCQTQIIPCTALPPYARLLLPRLLIMALALMLQEK